MKLQHLALAALLTGNAEAADTPTGETTIENASDGNEVEINQLFTRFKAAGPNDTKYSILYSDGRKVARTLVALLKEAGECERATQLQTLLDVVYNIESANNNTDEAEIMSTAFGGAFNETREANLAFGLQSPDVSDSVKKLISKLAKKHKASPVVPGAVFGCPRPSIDSGWNLESGTN